jgi:hypothetical protein
LPIEITHRIVVDINGEIASIPAITIGILHAQGVGATLGCDSLCCKGQNTGNDDRKGAVDFHKIGVGRQDNK